MTLTTCQQIILHCLFIAPSIKKSRGVERARRYRENHREELCMRMRQRRANSPELRQRERESAKRYKENFPGYRERENQRRRGNAAHREVENKRREILLRKINLLKMDRPCYDCGGSFAPHQMDWDHLPQYQKSFNIGSNQTSRSFESVIDEINKCQLVCSNCHRNRTETRKKDKVK